MSWLRHSTSRRRFLSGLAGVAGVVAVDPAALSRVAARASHGLPPAALPASATTATAGPTLAHLAWVWQFAQDGSKERIRAVLAAHDLGVVLKTHDGVEWMAEYDPSPDAVSGPARIAELARFFEDGGVPFHAWTVVNGEDPAREAEMAAEVLAAGARSISLDLEAHAGFWRGDARDALEFGRRLRRLQPAAWVVTSVDARPWEVDRVPLAEFSTFASEIAPQVYWSAFQTDRNLIKFTSAGYPPGEEGVTPRFALDAAVDKLRPFGLPVRPIGDGARGEAGEWDDFIEQAYANAAEAVSVWRFGVTAPDVWRLLKANPPLPLAYTVQAGDSLSVLAERWRTSVDAITDLNGIADPDLLRIGQRLRVPRGARVPLPPRLYTVQPGDTLTAIAGRFDTTTAAIVDLNGIANPNLLRPGQELRIPRGGPAPAPPLRYVVQPGDALGAIAQRFDTTTAAIADLNGIRDPNLLSVGQELLIPRGAPSARPAITYAVRPGDTLIAIAGRFDSTVEAIARANAIARPDLLRAGQVLTIP